MSGYRQVFCTRSTELRVESSERCGEHHAEAVTPMAMRIVFCTLGKLRESDPVEQLNGHVASSATKFESIERVVVKVRVGAPPTAPRHG